MTGLGCFAEYVVIPEGACVPVRRDVPLEVAALVGCAVSTGVGAAMYTADVRPGESVAVYGAGGVGLNIIMGAALCGAHPIIAVDTNSIKMEIAREFGATHAMYSDDTTVQQIQELTDSRGADHVFESVGLQVLQETAFDATRPWRHADPGRLNTGGQRHQPAGRNHHQNGEGHPRQLLRLGPAPARLPHIPGSVRQRQAHAGRAGDAPLWTG